MSSACLPAHPAVACPYLVGRCSRVTDEARLHSLFSPPAARVGGQLLLAVRGWMRRTNRHRHPDFYFDHVLSALRNPQRRARHLTSHSPASTGVCFRRSGLYAADYLSLYRVHLGRLLQSPLPELYRPVSRFPLRSSTTFCAARSSTHLPTQHVARQVHSFTESFTTVSAV